MILEFASVILQNSSLGSKNIASLSYRSLTLKYPCTSRHVCCPYIIKLKPAVYRIECWGSSGDTQYSGTPGLGAYTSGSIYISKEEEFYVYIGNTGFFNAIKGYDEPIGGSHPGGATDVRTSTAEKWWYEESLISRIMVAAGGGGAEGSSNKGGHGGTITGGTSYYFESENKQCSGATQTGSSPCENPTDNHKSYTGSFGSGGQTVPFNGDYGGFGGGGYYGGTSFDWAYGGSGGSSQSNTGHVGCDAVTDSPNPIKHTKQSIHYSKYVFTNTTMIAGNEIMPLPSGSEGIHSERSGAFRITLLNYNFRCTHQKTKKCFRFHWNIMIALSE